MYNVGIKTDMDNPKLKAYLTTWVYAKQIQDHIPSEMRGIQFYKVGILDDVGICKANTRSYTFRNEGHSVLQSWQFAEQRNESCKTEQKEVRYNTDSYKTESELIFTFCGDLCQITSK
jgi:hypothetical protein